MGKFLLLIQYLQLDSLVVYFNVLYFKVNADCVHGFAGEGVSRVSPNQTRLANLYKIRCLLEIHFFVAY